MPSAPGQYEILIAMGLPSSKYGSHAAKEVPVEQAKEVALLRSQMTESGRERAKKDTHHVGSDCLQHHR